MIRGHQRLAAGLSLLALATVVLLSPNAVAEAAGSDTVDVEQPPAPLIVPLKRAVRG